MWNTNSEKYKEKKAINPIGRNPSTLQGGGIEGVLCCGESIKIAKHKIIYNLQLKLTQVQIVK